MIALILNDGIEKYEQDIRELAMAFCPGEPFIYEKNPEAWLTIESGSEPGGSFFVSASENTEKTRIDRESFFLFYSRRENKSIIKTALYKILNRLSGKELPWGTLTGIRPVKLPESKLEKGMRDKDIRQDMKDEYLISDEKLDLIMDIAHLEHRELSAIPYRSGWSLYVGIAFCPTTCLYCSFTSYPIEKWKERLYEYLECIRKELRLLKEACNTEGSILYRRPLQTVYVGGGTPTALPAEHLRKLLEIIKSEADMSSVCEFTVEAGRPDSITAEKLDILKEFGVDRISINPQTMNQKTLDLIGRRHTVEDFRKAYAMAREKGFDNINMDIIMGLPGESIKDVEYTLSEIENMDPDSLTVHALAIKRAARLNTEKETWATVERADVREASVMTAMGAESAKRLNMKPYYLYRQKNMAGNQENVGYAKEGKVNLYNILMMEELHTVIGCGAGSSSKAVIMNKAPELYDGNENRVERFENIKNVAEYLPRIDELIEKKRKFLMINRQNGNN